MADVIDALIAEALGEGPAGIAAVAHVINARAIATGKTPEQIINEAGQFSGVASPGRSVAAAMRDPATREQVGQIWAGVQSGTIPNPYPGATHFHTPSVNPAWSGEFQRLGQQGNHIFYADGSVPQTRRVEPSMPTERPSTASTPWLTYTNQNATRSQQLNPDLVQAMSFLPEMGITMDVYSGGQPSSGPNRVGSNRHDHGNAGDVMFYKDGRMLDWNNADDLPILSNIVARAKAGGVTGIGAADDYMGPGRFHIGFGEPSVWGAGGRSANAPEWLRTAYYGAPTPPAVNAINRAAGAPTPVVMRPAAPQQGGGFWGNPLGFMKTATAGLTAPVMQAASSPNVQREAIGAMLGTVPGRTVIMRALMNQNIGKAPNVAQGHSGPGTRAMAVTSGGAAPVTLSGAPIMRSAMGAPAYDSVLAHGGGNSGFSGGGANSHMNMDVYRANAAALGSGGFNKSAIERALSDGKTLYKLA